MSGPTGGYDPLGLGSTGPGNAPEAAAPAGPRIRIAVPTTGEEEVDAVRQVLKSGLLTNGPAVRRFEEVMAQRHQTEFAVAFANGTVALAAMYLALGIGPGDEVIVPSFTFISTATSVLHVGAEPVFADIRPDTFDLDPADVEAKITDRTKAIVVVHYGGQAADLKGLQAVAHRAGVPLLEDAAEAHGATFAGRPVGGWGEAAMFSFTPTKNITTGEGSIVTTNDPAIDRSLRLLRNHGMTAQYRHETLGWNWRLSDILAAIGVCQVARLDELLVRKRANAAVLDRLLGALDGVTPPVVAPERDHTYMLYTVRISGQRRDAVREALADAGIEARLYFPPAHRQPVFSAKPVELPQTEQTASEVLSLPVHAHLSAGDLESIAAAVAAGLG